MKGLGSVPSPYALAVHPYPTRYHGAIYTRPTFGMPYVQNSYAVFKPDDFYEFYGVSGMGSLGGGSLGLGATGSPIYYLASKTNTKVSTLQTGLSKVLISRGYLPITVNGIFDKTTCGALIFCGSQFMEDLRALVPDEIITEATKTAQLAQKNGAVFVLPVKNPNPPVQITENRTVQTPPTVVPPVIESPAPSPPVKTGNDPSLNRNLKCISSNGKVDGNQCVWDDGNWCDIDELNAGKCVRPTSIPDMQIPGNTPLSTKSKSNTSMFVLIGLGILAAGGVYYVTKKRKS